MSRTMASRDSFESDEDTFLQPSDEDVLRDEEDVEQLLNAPKKGITTLFQGRERDPNLPKELDKSELRRQRQRERRAERRARRRRRKGKPDDEASLMYEMEEGGDRTSDDGSSTQSEEAFLSEKVTPRMTKRAKLLHLTLTPIALLSIFILLYFGAFSVSTTLRAEANAKKTLRSNGTHTFAPTTILVSLDGFRADFLKRDLTPTLNEFINSGVSPRYMLPSFPSVTFPNHFTLVTGLYPESHGVVGNTFYDPDMQEQFHNTVPSKSMFPKWWTGTGAEALWSTAEKQGIRAAVHMWPGSEAHLLPEPSTVDKYNGSETLSRKVERVLGFLDRPSELDSPPVFTPAGETRPQFIAMYVPDVDSDGHLYGPNSTEIRGTIKEADDMLASLFSGLEARNLTETVNVVVVSDHGMATTSNDRLIQLEDLLDISQIEHIDGWPLYGLRPYPSVDIAALYKSLNAQAKSHGHFQVFTRETMPERWHFSSSPRIAPIWIIPETGWAVVHKEDFDVEQAQKDNTIYHPRGLHGYDHEHPLMRAIFVARGPAFPHSPGSRVEVFQNTEVYNIVCDSLEMEPKPNNGTLRLPLKTVGTHADDEDGDKAHQEAVDLPSSIGGTSMVRTRTSKTMSATATASPTPSAVSNEVSEENKENIETHKDVSGWQSLINKIKQGFQDAKDWIKDKVHGGKGENEDEDKHE